MYEYVTPLMIGSRGECAAGPPLPCGFVHPWSHATYVSTESLHAVAFSRQHRQNSVMAAPRAPTGGERGGNGNGNGNPLPLGEMAGWNFVRLPFCLARYSPDRPSLPPLPLRCRPGDHWRAGGLSHDSRLALDRPRQPGPSGWRPFPARPSASGVVTRSPSCSRLPQRGRGDGSDWPRGFQAPGWSALASASVRLGSHPIPDTQISTKCPESRERRAGALGSFPLEGAEQLEKGACCRWLKAWLIPPPPSPRPAAIGPRALWEPTRFMYICTS